MLAVKSYPKSYIDACEARMKKLLAAYGELGRGRGTTDTFEEHLFTHLVLAMDHLFVHRTRAIEGKDGNPLNEVRMLCASILQNEGVLMADKTIRHRAAASVLKLRPGDRITLDDQVFAKLFQAYFEDLRARFG